MTTGELIKSAIEGAGMTLTDVSRATRIDISALSKWTLGKGRPRREKLDVLAEVLHTNAEALIGDDGVYAPASGGGKVEKKAAKGVNVSGIDQIIRALNLLCDGVDVESREKLLTVLEIVKKV